MRVYLSFVVSAILLTTQVKGSVYHGSTTIQTASPESQLNVTVPYMTCFTVPALHVGVWTRVVDSSLPYKFSMMVHTINILSFEALLNRTYSATAWNSTAIKVDWQAYHSTAAYNRPGGFNIFYTYLSYNITWYTARSYCQGFPDNRTLCTASQICPHKNIRITVTAFGDTWAPIKNSENDWIMMGNDYSVNPIRLCLNHFNKYRFLPRWGKSSGACLPLSNEFNPCFLKGHVFCCKQL